MRTRSRNGVPFSLLLLIPIIVGVAFLIAEDPIGGGDPPSLGASYNAATNEIEFTASDDTPPITVKIVDLDTGIKIYEVTDHSSPFSGSASAGSYVGPFKVTASDNIGQKTSVTVNRS
jgi:hypothetical protein